MKEAEFNGYVYNFSVDYDATGVDDIVDIRKYLMKKMTQCNKMLGFFKKVFFVGLKILSSFTSVNSLSCISVKNQEWKTRPQVVNVNGDEPVFFHLVLKQVNVVVVVIISIIRMQKFVFLML